MKFKVGEICLSRSVEGYYAGYIEVTILAIGNFRSYKNDKRDVIVSCENHPAGWATCAGIKGRLTSFPYLKKLPPQNEQTEWEDLEHIWIPSTEETIEAEYNSIPEEL